MNDTACPTCREYDTEIQIRGRGELRRVVDEIQTAIRDKKLSCRDADPPQTIAGQQHFFELDLDSAMPDIIDHRFECTRCGRRYALECETYHGSGGRWRRL